jgi:hypothetical protein
MRRWQWWTQLLLGFVSISAVTAPALAQEDAIPLDVLRIWQHHNNNGWWQLERGKLRQGRGAV